VAKTGLSFVWGGCGGCYNTKKAYFNPGQKEKKKGSKRSSSYRGEEGCPPKNEALYPKKRGEGVPEWGK